MLKKRRWLNFTTDFIKVIYRQQDKTAYQTFLFQILPDSKRKQLLLKTLPYINHEFFYKYIDTSRIYNSFFNARDLNTSLVRHFQYKLEHLLRMEDRNSMAFSLEARVPYLDYRLIEYLLSVPENLKIKAGETKYLQKKAVGKYSIPEIVDRKDKIGFGTPGDEWMLTEKWQRLTFESYKELFRDFSGVFMRRQALPKKGFDIWKINQLYTWKNIFLK